MGRTSAELALSAARGIDPVPVGLSVLVAGLALVSLGIGPVPLGPWHAFLALIDGQGPAGIIVRDLRLPRMLLAILIGGSLGLSGAALQGLMRNPLAAPSVFGAPQAAGLGAVIALYFRFVDVYSWALPLAAIAGAFLSVALVVLVAGPRAATTVLVLAGLAVGSLAGAATSLAISLAQSLRGHRDRVLAARVLGGPHDAACRARGALPAGRHGSSSGDRRRPARSRLATRRQRRSASP